MDQDRVDGIRNKVAGSPKKALGRLTSAWRLEAEGTAQKTVGAAQNTVGGVKDTVHGVVGK